MQDLFLIIQDYFPSFTKKDVDNGEISVELSRTCDLLRTVFFLSNRMRKNRDMFLHFLEPSITIKFVSKKLRYLGPDERSMLMLVLKALDVKIYNQREGEDARIKFVKSTPGVSVARGATISQLLGSMGDENPTFQADIIKFQTTTPSRPTKITITDSVLSFIKREGKVLLFLPSLDIDGWLEENIKEQFIKEKLNTVVMECSKEITTIEDQIMILNVLEDNLSNGTE